MTSLTSFLFSFSPIYKYRVVGKSMLPTYREGQVLLVNRLSYVFFQPKINDCIVLKDPRDGREILKRVTRVKDEKFFVEGDNKKESTDSRTFGFVQKKAIVGKVISTLA